MFYCEKCKCPSQSDRCSSCGAKRLREIEDGDYCLLTVCGGNYGQALLSGLEEEGIPFAAIPVGSGVRSAFAMRLENSAVYVPYKFLQAAKDMSDSFFGVAGVNLRDELMQNLHKLNISAKLEGKARRKLKVENQKDFLEYCRTKIAKAVQVEDKGLIGDLEWSEASYVYVKTDSESFLIHSETYEILYVSKL